MKHLSIYWLLDSSALDYRGIICGQHSCRQAIQTQDASSLVGLARHAKTTQQGNNKVQHVVKNKNLEAIDNNTRSTGRSGRENEASFAKCCVLSQQLHAHTGDVVYCTRTSLFLRNIIT